MSLEYPEDLRYLDSHEYVRLEGEIATIGISAFAVQQLGDVVFVELPEVNDTVTRNDRFGTIESVKAVEELNSPVTGTVIERNDAIIESPEEIADDPYGEGWLLKVRVNDPGDIDDALTAKDYSTLVAGE
ncbi:glycine cleavage system protein GcvH [Tolypothrix sp. VBCCA 56010]|uniref:glycine cleavage system protein GcvH n=1 Tax=Tolypothrix sp. VBCCA 56010 TaxID=3137731 RepID=UPI003D7D9233